MTSQRTAPAPWLHDDSEEDLVGADVLRILDMGGRPVPFTYELAALTQEQERRIAEFEIELARLRGTDR